MEKKVYKLEDVIAIVETRVQELEISKTHDLTGRWGSIQEGCLKDNRLILHLLLARQRILH